MNKQDSLNLQYHRKRLDILNWAQQHGWVINPVKRLDQYVQNILDLGRCPCNEHRKECPCPNSIDDVRNTGHCLCHLFWSDYQRFGELYHQAIARILKRAEK